MTDARPGKAKFVEEGEGSHGIPGRTWSGLLGLPVLRGDNGRGGKERWVPRAQRQ